jgi:hypothetical protein
MAYKIQVVSSDVTVFSKRGTIKQKLPAGQTVQNQFLSAAYIFGNASQLPANGSVRVKLKDKDNNIVVNEILAGQFGGLNYNFEGAFGYETYVFLYATAASSASTIEYYTLDSEASLVTTENQNESIQTRISCDVNPTAYSTGSLEIEFSGGLEDSSVSQLTAGADVVLGTIDMYGKISGNMKITINFSCVTV